jgi:hypothetical protein
MLMLHTFPFWWWLFGTINVVIAHASFVVVVA